MYFLKNLLLHSGAWFRQNKCIVMMTIEWSTKILNFMIPRAGVLLLGRGHISHIVKMYYYFKNILLYSQAWIRQFKYIVMMSKEGSTQIVNFMNSGAGVLAVGCGQISHIVKMHYSLKNLLLCSHA